MWFFNSPEIFFGEDALSRLDELIGKRAFIVTDPGVARLGLVKLVEEHLKIAGLEWMVFSEVEPEPSLHTVRRGAEAMLAYEPDWIIGLGGGSSMDAAKAMWILYERPDMEPAGISPLEFIGLRSKARLISIPTTAGTGSEVGYACVLTDTDEQRKLTLGSREATADLAIVDPIFTTNLPRQITADTGIDVLTHAVEGYTSTWANDFTDGACLIATRLVFTYLPRAVQAGAQDPEARERMANAATLAGLALGNSQVALAHALGHSAGALLHMVHGRVTGLFLPYTIEFTANAGLGRYSDLAHILRLPYEDERKAASALVSAIRELLRCVGQPLSMAEAGVPADQFELLRAAIADHTEMDTAIVMARRQPTRQELERLIDYSYEGKPVDF